MAISEDKLKTALYKFSQSAGWLKFLGVLQIIYGILTLLGLVGILFIWLGLTTMKMANNFKEAYQNENGDALVEGASNFNTIITVLGILSIISLIATIIVGLIYGAIIMAALFGGFSGGY